MMSVASRSCAIEPRPSEAISGTIRGDQRPSEAIRGASRTCAIEPRAIRGNQRKSEEIRGNQRPSEAINVASRTCAIEPSKRDERSRSLGTTGKISPPPELAAAAAVVAAAAASAAAGAPTAAKAALGAAEASAKVPVAAPADAAAVEPAMVDAVEAASAADAAAAGSSSPAGRSRYSEHLHARQVISGNQRTRELAPHVGRAAMSTCMQGRSSVAINGTHLRVGWAPVSRPRGRGRRGTGRVRAPWRAPDRRERNRRARCGCAGR